MSYNSILGAVFGSRETVQTHIERSFNGSLADMVDECNAYFSAIICHPEFGNGRKVSYFTFWRCFNKEKFMCGRQKGNEG